jgi:hypothetical protein
VTAAIFGLLGVLIGGVLNGIIQWRLDLARGKLAARSASRLVAEEIYLNLARLASSITHGTTHLLRQLDHAAWAAHRSELAVTLDDSHWYKLVEAYSALNAIEETRPLDQDDHDARGLKYIEEFVRPVFIDLAGALRGLHNDPRLAMLEQIANGPIGARSASADGA